MLSEDGKSQHFFARGESKTTAPVFLGPHPRKPRKTEAVLTSLDMVLANTVGIVAKRATSKQAASVLGRHGGEHGEGPQDSNATLRTDRGRAYIIARLKCAGEAQLSIQLQENCCLQDRRSGKKLSQINGRSVPKTPGFPLQSSPALPNRSIEQSATMPLNQQCAD